MNVSVVDPVAIIPAVTSATVVGAVTCVYTYACGISRRQECARADDARTRRYVCVYVHMCDVEVEGIFYSLHRTYTFRSRPCPDRGFGDDGSHEVLDLS